MGKDNLSDYFATLNDEQCKAVLHTGKPLLILAGAGSGKTRVITTKIAYFIREKNIKPWSILAVTFTNKAAKEMSERATLLESRASDSMIRTFHSFGAWFLRRNAAAAGLEQNFSIYDDDDMVSLLGAISDKKKEDLRYYAQQIARLKDRNLGPECDGISRYDPTEELQEIYQKYEQRMLQIGNVDFGDLIKKPVEILRQNPEIAERIHDRFRVIMVDEYQDANVAQFELLKELCGSDTYLCAVGDDDQSIYRFRGAEVQNILQFPTMFGDVDIVKLEKNYRSTGEILDLAHSVIQNNKGRHDKKLEAARGSGTYPKLYFLPDQETEAKLCADLIERSMKKKGISDGAAKPQYADWAILYRTNAQSLGFENEFIHRRIPYRIVGSLKFYEREEIKDALALIAFMFNPRDEISFRRVINKPARGIGESAITRILEARWNEQDWNIETTLKHIVSKLSPKAQAGVKTFLSAIDNGHAALEDDTNNENSKNTHLKYSSGLSKVIAALIETSGIVEYHLRHDDNIGEQRISNLQELVNSAVLYENSLQGLTDFLEHIELDRAITLDADSEDRVTLITLHNTKGLEFKHVIMTGLEQGLFPRADKKDDELEEERRLFYVGATRAMDELYLTSCAVRRMWGQISFMKPSLFLREADNSRLEIVGEAFDNYQKHKVFSSNIRTVSSDGRWQFGDRVFNEDNGYGEVVGIQETEDGPLVKVTFETGRTNKFLSKAQSKNYMKIKE